MDTKQIFENRMRWLEQMRHAPKTTGRLTEVQFLPGDIKQEADCCLGAACKSINVLRKELSPNIFYYGHEICGATLPKDGQRGLQIGETGELTRDGTRAAVSMTTFHYLSLVEYNDTVYKADTTLDNMRSLIQWLFCLEYLFGIECFQSPDHT